MEEIKRAVGGARDKKNKQRQESKPLLYMAWRSDAGDEKEVQKRDKRGTETCYCFLFKG